MLNSTARWGRRYPEKLVKAVQRKLGIQVDGDFGRQTLVSVLTNGRVKMVPVTYEEAE